ncbi:hypothetical protein SGL43_00679 [Streptomyces globisporus]|uniref:Uncharacterized protein n=1 Tax=Streptomyces globisporus TaxID=1908 RepID=A0ABM9GS73_STRGL|nr:hypothetical protein SGL43_00679 [Streptomyces globisporus]
MYTSGRCVGESAHHADSGGEIAHDRTEFVLNGDDWPAGGGYLAHDVSSPGNRRYAARPKGRAGAMSMTLPSSGTHQLLENAPSIASARAAGGNAHSRPPAPGRGRADGCAG